MNYKLKIKKIKNGRKLMLVTPNSHFTFTFLLNKNELVSSRFNVTVKSVGFRLILSGNLLEKLVKAGVIS